MNAHERTNTRAALLRPNDEVEYGILWDYTDDGFRTGFGRVISTDNHMALVSLSAEDVKYMDTTTCLFVESRLRKVG